MPHVAIIGAGPAGSTAALLLARGGWRVTLVEQQRFPRDKVCGECLSALGIDVLHRLNLAEPLQRRFSPAVFTRAILHAPDGSSASLPLPRRMWGMARQEFDSFLLEMAASAGAQVLQPARCEQIEDHPEPMIQLHRLDSNATETIRVDVVIVADGKGALLPNRAPPTRDFGIKAHFDGIGGPRDAIELFGAAGCYGGLAAVAGHLYNVAFSVPQEQLRRHRGDVEALFEQIASRHAALRLRLRGARRVTAWLAAPLPRFALRSSLSPRIIPVGNAAAAIEPIGGEGMGLAMRSAELAAEELIRCEHEGRPVRTAELRALLQRAWGMRRVACRAAALAFSSPWLTNVGLPHLERLGPLPGHALRLVGK